jgi:hypothetical protein
MTTSSSGSSSGISFAGALTVAFVVLKLYGVVAWSWWWVLSPLWISFLLAVVIIAVVFTCLVVTSDD